MSHDWHGAHAHLAGVARHTMNPARNGLMMILARQDCRAVLAIGLPGF